MGGSRRPLIDLHGLGVAVAISDGGGAGNDRNRCKLSGKDPQSVAAGVVVGIRSGGNEQRSGGWAGRGQGTR